MKNKAQIFIYNKRENKFLLIKELTNQNFNRLTFVTQVSEKENNLKDISSKIKHQTGLSVIRIFSLSWGSVYNSEGQEVKEMNYFACVNLNKSPMNKKNLKYKWLDVDSFIKEINWKDNKELLKKVLLKAINNEVYFDKKERGQ